MIFLCVTSSTLMTLRVKLFDSKCYVNIGNEMTSSLKKTTTTKSHRDWQLKWVDSGTSLAVQWLRLHASTAGGMGSIPGRGTKIPHAAQRSQK